MAVVSSKRFHRETLPGTLLQRSLAWAAALTLWIFLLLASVLLFVLPQH